MTNKEAIKILKNYHNGYFGYKIDDVHEAHNLAIKALEERPQGEWVYEHDWVHCSFCGHEQNYPSNFCPNCGMYSMKGDKS